MSGGGGFIGDIVGGVGDIDWWTGREKSSVSLETVDSRNVADVAKNLDIEDAAKTYILTGGFNLQSYAAAFAATDYDEKLGFNPASFYNPTTGGFGFDTGSSFMPGDNPFNKVLDQQCWSFW
jgi:hypothetical protein